MERPAAIAPDERGIPHLNRADVAMNALRADHAPLVAAIHRGRGAGGVIAGVYGGRTRSRRHRFGGAAVAAECA